MERKNLKVSNINSCELRFTVDTKARKNILHKMHA